MTVLFADVVRSMNIAAALGPERLREIMTKLLDRCSVIIHRYGGTVDKFTGDGIMAVFGAPIALEDHAVRACLTALDIQKTARELAAEVQSREASTSNAGRTELGRGDCRRHRLQPVEYTAVGHQVGLAQRMESLASPGGVMLSESTARLVADVAMLGEPEGGQIKDGDQLVPARPLLAMRAGRPRADLQRRVSTLVGRKWELAALGAMLDQATAGRGRVVSVVGPGGIGKSRTVDGVVGDDGRAWSGLLRRTASRIPAKSRSWWWPGCCERRSGWRA